MRDLAWDAEAPPLVACHDLRFSAGGAVRLEVPRLHLRAGAPTAVLGPNGAGKSLLLRLLHGLIAPQEGRVIAAPEVRQAMVFQRPVLLRRSVAANLDYALRAAGEGRRARRARLPDLLSQFGFAASARQPARTLSGGEQQRLALVRALATAPDVLFLDEPTASLDPAATHAIETLLAQADAQGTKIVIVTHDPGQARRLGGEVLLLNRGRIAERTPATQFFAAPRSPEGRAYLSGALLL
ncbi:ATP-binding cassette domain-containing protein [Rhodobacteraceae bacterium CCMM004]|nr:ATP-binding cassette domain-containing protein [Rhodobacteraceae bacterium CCMM004]